MTQRNNNRLRIAFLVVLIFSVALACNLPTGSSQSDRPSFRNEDNEDQIEPTETSTPTFTATIPPIPTNTNPPLPTKTELPTETPFPTASPTIEGVYHLENFDYYDNSGPLVRQEGVVTEFLDGELIVEISVPSQGYTISLNSNDYSNIMITAWAQFEGDDAATVGLFCQATLADDLYYFYEFLISRGGDYSLEYRSSPQTGDMTIIETLAQGHTDVLYAPGPNVWNGIQAACMNDRLMFFVNGELLVDVTTNRPVQAGFAGLAHYNPAEAEYQRVIWDMVSISQP